ncbi:putative quinol monooxygenase [Pedobacter sp. N23S346]|uniref:putative quinol monooxygenase n=1 Tax=Pedobacter sp. N23S346 TaxID=3402750 RepID=UPI003ABE0AD0
MMKNDKIITHVEFPVDPEFTDEVVLNAIQTRDLILLEEGTEVFILTYKKEEPNTLVIFAIYTSKELYDWHLEQAYVKSFFSFLMGKLLEAPRVTYLESII